MSAATNTSISWDQVLWPANCGKCGNAFDCLVENHLSLCAGCQKQFTDCDSCEMRYDHTQSGNPTRCEDCVKQQFADCDKCGGYFDRLAYNHPTRCGVCQELFEASEPTAAVAPTTTKAPRAPPSKEHYVYCKLCSRHFPPNKRNNGIHCTLCCNTEARKGNDLFARNNTQPSKEASELLKNAPARKQKQAAPVSGLSVATAARAMLTCQQPGFLRFGGM